MALQQSRGQLASSWRQLRLGAVERLDDREEYGEERFVTVGLAEGHVVLFVAYTEREERIRIISARRATQHEQDNYFQRGL